MKKIDRQQRVTKHYKHKLDEYKKRQKGVLKDIKAQINKTDD